MSTAKQQVIDIINEQMGGLDGDPAHQLAQLTNTEQANINRHNARFRAFSDALLALAERVDELEARP